MNKLSIGLCLGIVLIILSIYSLVTPYFIYYNFIFFGYLFFFIANKKSANSNDFNIVITTAIIIAYYIRPIFLYKYPFDYSFQNVISEINSEHIEKSLIKSTWFYFIVSIINLLYNKFFKKNKIMQREISPVKFKIVLNIILALSVLKLFLTLFLGIGMKTSFSGSSLAFLYSLIPADILYLFTLLSVLSYWDKISFNSKVVSVVIMFVSIIGVLLTGSKIFLAILFLILFSYLVYYNIRIKLKVILFFAVFAFYLFPISFIISSHVKRGDFSLAQIPNYTVEIFEGGSLVMAEVSARFMGVDGNIAIEEMVTNKSPSYFDLAKNNSVINQVLRIGNQLLPGIKLSDTYSSGKAVSVYVNKLSPTIHHAGAVGIIGSLIVFSDKWGISMVLYSIFLVYLVDLFSYSNRSVLGFIKFYLISYFIIHLSMSGNFDTLMADLIVKYFLVWLFVYIIPRLKI